MSEHSDGEESDSELSEQSDSKGNDSESEDIKYVKGFGDIKFVGDKIYDKLTHRPRPIDQLVVNQSQ